LSGALRDLFQRGAAEFDSGHFFAAHELWEQLWKASAEPQRSVLQGLIQLAAAALHAQRGNAHGARLLCEKAKGRLSAARTALPGVDTKRVVAEVEVFLDAKARGTTPACRPRIGSTLRRR
jgi:predicted metal-dependent hydrolase